MFGKSCIKSDLHCSFLTRTPLNSFWFSCRIHWNRRRYRPGHDSLLGLHYQEPNLIVIAVQSQTCDWRCLTSRKQLLFVWIRNLFLPPKRKQRWFNVFRKVTLHPVISWIITSTWEKKMRRQIETESFIKFKFWDLKVKKGGFHDKMFTDCEKV